MDSQPDISVSLSRIYTRCPAQRQSDIIDDLSSQPRNINDNPAIEVILVLLSVVVKHPYEYLRVGVEQGQDAGAAGLGQPHGIEVVRDRIGDERRCAAHDVDDRIGQGAAIHLWRANALQNLAHNSQRRETA